MFQCKQCAGAVRFDITTQTVRCLQCGTQYVPEELDNQKAQSDIDCFRCRDCGAQLIGTDESQVGFCPYCGSQGLLPSDEEKNTLDRIIPFQISREQCAEQFRHHLSRVPFLPRSFRNRGEVTNFTGIYVPFHTYSVHVDDVQAKGKKIIERHSRYNVEGTFQMDVSLEKPDCQVPFDASRYLDDDISKQLAPFDEDLERDFHPSYLAGFYADTSTVPENVYEKDAVECVKEDLSERVTDQISASGMQNPTCTVSASLQDFREALYPAWFLTWREKNRIAYAVINGESGKVVSDLPVSFGAFAAGCLIVFCVLFFLLEMFFQPTPEITSLIAVAVSCLMAGLIRHNAKKIATRESHLNDKGWNWEERQNEPVKKKKAKDYGIAGGLFILGVYLTFKFLPLLVDAFDSTSTRALFMLATVPLLILLLIFSVQTFRQQKNIQERTPFLSALLVLLTGVINAALLVILPVSDLWFYVGNAACILSLIIASVLMLRLYNLCATRPIPHMSDREEVGTP